MSEPHVTMCSVNGPRQSVGRSGGDGLVRHPFTLDEPELRELATRLVWAGPAGTSTRPRRRWMPGSPAAFACTPCCPRSRRREGSSLIRVPSPHPLRLADLEARGFFGEKQRLSECVLSSQPA